MKGLPLMMNSHKANTGNWDEDTAHRLINLKIPV
jgi:hypothetical protein